jgi:hypothetical protein
VLAGSANAGLPGFERHGIEVRYPDSWHLSPRPMSNLLNPTFRFTVATFVPERHRGDEGPCLAGLARQRGAKGAYVYLLEDLDAERYLRRFPPRTARFRLPVAGEVASCDGRWSRWIPFRTSGRGFYLGVSIGPEASARTRTQLRHVLASLTITRKSSRRLTVSLARRGHATTGGGDDWSDLRRPLHLPRVMNEDACPRTPGRRAAPNVAITLGNGPAYPVLGFLNAPSRTRGSIRLRDDIRRDSRYLHKTLWAISKRYHGPVLVRGRRIDEPGVLRFLGPTRRELHLSRGQGKPDAPGRGWRYAPTTTLIPAPGCYAFQIDGLNFSRVAVFAARR